MKKFILLFPAAAVIVVILFFIFSNQGLSTTLEITVQDAVSKSWVYNTSIRIQDRVIRGFKSLTYTFKNIKTGRHTLSISAPYYESNEIDLNIHPGKNVIKEPVELWGLIIPDLDSISIFEKKKEDNMYLDIRLIGKDGHAVTDHPCLPLQIK